MAIFNFDEAVYGVLCYIFGKDDNTVSSEEQDIMNEGFYRKHDLSYETKRTIIERWACKGSESFFRGKYLSIPDIKFNLLSPLEITLPII